MALDSSTPRVYFAVSAHGYGHLIQSVAVIRALRDLYPSLELLFHCAYPKPLVVERLGFDDFMHTVEPVDIGLVQSDALNVDVAATVAAYHEFHQDYPLRVHSLARRLKEWSADIVISDIAYLPLMAADVAGIPGLALASLSWDHILRSYFDANQPGPAAWYQDICESYRSADLALLPQPAMQPVCFASSKMVSPIFLPGRYSPLVRKNLGINESDRRPLVFCSLGGSTAGQLPIDAMRQERGLHWLINAETLRDDTHLHGLWQLDGVPFRDIIASVDAVIGKPGYGMAVEAAAYNIPFVFTRRGHFPDEPVITDWLKRHARSVELTNEDWFGGHFVEPLLKLLQTTGGNAPFCNGAEEAAREIQQLL